jgi:parallel beta-helix repeat protein
MKTINKVAISAVAVIIIVVIVYIEYNRLHVPNFTPTPPPTNNIIVPVNVFNVSSCKSITSPGVYHVVRDISSNQADGPCINISSSNVALLGNNDKITGNGPYVQIPPFSYGVEISDASNVVVSNLTLSKFSYDIFLDNVSYSKIFGANVLNATISGIYLYNSRYNLVENNRAYFTAGLDGGIGLTGGGNNTVQTNLVVENAYNGLYINSSNNHFINDTLEQNPIDIACISGSGLRYSNMFSSSVCAVNYYCNFAYCSDINVPSGLGYALSNQINRCGVIESPGDYRVGSDLNLSFYVNTSNPQSVNTCIRIDSPNVRLNCSNNTIYNSHYGVLAAGVYNTTLANCYFYNDTYGIYLANSFSNNVIGGGAAKGRYALYLNNESITTISNVDYHGNVYGIYINNSEGLTFRGNNVNNNTYGIYYNNGTTLSFFNNKINSDTNGDLFCSVQTYGSRYETFENNQCGSSDCNWANCASHFLPPQPTYPISSCGVISTPGNYVLQSVITSTAGGNCIKINANNVNFDCQGKFLYGVDLGNAFSIANKTNVSIDNCEMFQYALGINATNVKSLNLQNDIVENSSSGVSLTNANYSQIINLNVIGFGGYGFSMNRVNDSVITNNTADNGVNNATGFVFSKSNRNIITFNDAENNPDYGFVFANSISNLILNNTAVSNFGYDYNCVGGSSGLYAEAGLTNRGLNKNRCFWMIETDPLISNSCLAISSGSTISMPEDMLYTYGRTCFTVYNTNSTTGSYTVINCNNHTVMATNGGVFADIVNSSSVTIENCYLEGFSRAIEVSGPSAHILNNTIVYSNYSVLVNGTTYPVIAQNKMENDTYGIYSQNSRYGTIEENTFRHNVTTAITLSGGSAYNLMGNFANNTRIGLYLINSQTNIAENNSFLNSALYGIACTQFAENQSNNLDDGGNACSSNINCRWMTASPSCKPS